jgi:hypothetical protein
VSRERGGRQGHGRRGGVRSPGDWNIAPGLCATARSRRPAFICLYYIRLCYGLASVYATSLLVLCRRLQYYDLTSPD